MDDDGRVAAQVIAVAASLVAALLYAGASVLQHRSARAAPAERSMRLGLLGGLLAEPWWLAGMAADGAAFGMQFIALGHGPLVVVQPMLVSGLLFALPLGAIVSHRRIRATDLWGAAAVVVGLAALLVSADPSAGQADVSASRWAVLAVATLVPVGVLCLAALRWPAAKAGLLASAAAVCYGLTAALAKTSAHLLGTGVGHALASWQPYALLPVGLLGMVLCQSAFQAGPLRASLPLLSAVDPLVSIAIGVGAFSEHVAQDPLRVTAEVLGTVVMVAGVLSLGRSPLVALSDVAPEADVSPAVPGRRQQDRAEGSAPPGHDR